MSFTIRPMVFAVRGGRLPACWRSRRRPPRVLLCGLALLAAGFSDAPGPTDILPATRQFEVPPELGPYQRELIQRLASENTERFRMRVTLPAAAFDTPPIVRKTAPANGGLARDTAAFQPVGTVSFLLKLVWIVLGIFVWYLIARKLAPEFAESMATWLRSWSLLPSVPTKQLVTLLAEEKAVAEFQAALQAGARAPADSPVSADVQAADGGLLPAAIGKVREIHRCLQEAARSEAASAQRRFFLEALERMQPLKNLARPAELLPLRQMATAVEMLLKQLTEKSGNVTSSTLRTATLGVNLLEDLCQPGLQPGLLSEPPLRLLAVDDEAFSRFALAHSLRRGPQRTGSGRTGRNGPRVGRPPRLRSDCLGRSDAGHGRL